MAAVETPNQYTAGAVQTTLTANLIEITMQGHAIGRAQNASSQVSYGTQGVYQIGTIYPVEHVYTKYEGTLTLERVMLRNESLATLHLAPLGDDVLATGTIDVIIKNKEDNNKIIQAFLGCTAQNYSMTLRANEMVSESVTMVYLKASLVDK